MKTITVESEVDLEEFISDISTIDLVNELIYRNADGVIKLNSVQDQIKFEALKQKFYDIPESDLDEFLSRY